MSVRSWEIEAHLRPTSLPLRGLLKEPSNDCFVSSIDIYFSIRCIEALVCFDWAGARINMQRPSINLIKPLRSILHVASGGTARGLPSRLSGRDLEADVAFCGGCSTREAKCQWVVIIF